MKRTLVEFECDGDGDDSMLEDCTRNLSVDISQVRNIKERFEVESQSLASAGWLVVWDNLEKCNRHYCENCSHHMGLAAPKPQRKRQ